MATSTNQLGHPPVHAQATSPESIVKCVASNYTPTVVMQEFSDLELVCIRQVLAACYQRDIEIQLADCELSSGHQGDESVYYPTVFWYATKANFMVFKLGNDRFRAQFFYTPHEQYPIGSEQEFDDLDQCVKSVIQAQADHERENLKSDRVQSGNQSPQ